MGEHIDTVIESFTVLGLELERRAPRAACRMVDQAGVALGERGPVWWTDGALTSIAIR